MLQNTRELQVFLNPVVRSTSKDYWKGIFLGGSYSQEQKFVHSINRTVLSRMVNIPTPLLYWRCNLVHLTKYNNNALRFVPGKPSSPKVK